LLLTVVLWTAVFHHTFYETIPIELQNTTKIQREAKRLRNNSSNAAFPLINSYKSGKLSKEEFFSMSSNLEMQFLKYEEEASELFKEIKKVQSKHRVFGFDSYNIFSFQLSMQIILFICILSLIVSIRIKDKSKNLLKAFNLITCNFLIICAFYTTWVFYKGNDMHYWAYLILLSVIAIVSGITTYLIINWIFNTIQKSKIKNQEFIHNAKYALELLKQKVREESVK